MEKESEVQRQSTTHLSHVHGSHNKQNTSLMNGHRCFTASTCIAPESFISSIGVGIGSQCAQ